MALNPPHSMEHIVISLNNDCDKQRKCEKTSFFIVPQEKKIRLNFYETTNMEFDFGFMYT